MNFTFKCLACGWAGTIEAKGFTEALSEGRTGHLREGGKTNAQGESRPCADADPVFQIRRIRTMMGEGIYFPNCPECGWMASVEAGSPAHAKTIGAIKHGREVPDCLCKEMVIEETEEVVEERLFG